MKHYDRDGIQLWHGDALETLRELPDGAAQMCVTSPPYWGLRDYGTAAWDGGAEDCDHVERQARMDGGRPATMVPRGIGGAMVVSGTSTPVPSTIQYRDLCGKCGARRIDRQLGLEATPEAYVAGMVAVFREVRRVLRDDGTLWLNIGDSYAGGGYSNHDATGGALRDDGAKQRHTPSGNIGLKPKDLVGIPWMLAFALRADGWYLRSDIIWSKPNPMPESVTDRPTKAHEYLFLLSKSARYYYDADAIREPHSEASVERMRTPHAGVRDRFDASNLGASNFTRYNDRETGWGNPGGRNKRDVWTIATAPYPDAHFATFPPDLVRPCILAGTSEAGVVLDPFAGSGTVLQVAKEFGRGAIGIELNAEYLPMITARVDRMPAPMPLFAPTPTLAEQGALI